jgi:hypothetical protein
MSEAKSIFIYCYASNPDAAAWMLKFVFVYLANTTVLCYSLTIICCCQVQDYIYWIISTENDHRHHHNIIKIWKTIEKRRKKHARLTYQAKSLPLQREFGRIALLWNYWANLNQTLLKWSLGGPLSKLCPSAPSCIQDGHHY